MSDIATRYRICRAFGVAPFQQITPGAHLRVYETICPCGKCGLYHISEYTIELFEAIRAEMNEQRAAMGREARGISISSGVRCREYNTALRARGIASSENSLHVPQWSGSRMGHALDCICPHDMSQELFFDLVAHVLEEYPQAGLGLYPVTAARKRAFVHIDDGYGRQGGRRWTL